MSEERTYILTSEEYSDWSLDDVLIGPPSDLLTLAQEFQPGTKWAEAELRSRGSGAFRALEGFHEAFRDWLVAEKGFRRGYLQEWHLESYGRPEFYEDTHGAAPPSENREGVGD